MLGPKLSPLLHQKHPALLLRPRFRRLLMVHAGKLVRTGTQLLLHMCKDPLLLSETNMFWCSFSEKDRKVVLFPQFIFSEITYW